MSTDIHRAYPVGQVVTILLAFGVTFLAAAQGWTWAWSDWSGWPALSIVIIAASWVNVFAWFSARWGLVIICSLLTFLAPWGFIYPGILAGPILACAAAIHWIQARRFARELRTTGF